MNDQRDVVITDGFDVVTVRLVGLYWLSQPKGRVFSLLEDGSYREMFTGFDPTIWYAQLSIACGS